MSPSIALSPTLKPTDTPAASELGRTPSQKTHNSKTARSNGSGEAPGSSSKQVKGLDSADLEARRQEQLEFLSERPGTSSMMPSEGRTIDPRDAVAESSKQGAMASSSSSSLAHLPSEMQLELLDNEPQGPFEGPEKLMELWFADSPDFLPSTALQASFSILQDGDGRSLAGAKGLQRLGLRAVPRQYWEEMLDLVKCKVLSVVEGREVDAYLLSESSMFVFPHKIILKTCGTTTLLLGLERLLELARCALTGSTDFVRSSANVESCDPDDSSVSAARKQLGSMVRQCFYSRKSFMFPERQKGPHKDWMLEVGLLEAFFEDGSAYTVGKMNGDHWLLYMCCPGDQEHIANSPLAIERPLQMPSPGSVDLVNDQTLEILMTHLSPASCQRFEFPSDLQLPPQPSSSTSQALDRGHLLGLDLSAKLGLCNLFSSTQLDAFAFEPCGYSANAVVPAGSTQTGGYWTIHVTPEADSSYASFETNVALRPGGQDAGAIQAMNGDGSKPAVDLPNLIERVVAIFKPGNMSITLFLSSRSKHSNGGSQGDERAGNADDGSLLHSLKLPGYIRKDRIAYEFESYDLIFCHFKAITQ